jgi:hypothetical protein
MTDRFSYWMRGDEAAAEFCRLLYEAIQVWDDVVDGDEPGATINDPMSWLLFRMEWQPFYARNAMILKPVLLSSYLGWRDATALERDPSRTDADLEKAFMLRAGVYDVFAVCAWLIGGEGWSREVGPEIRRAYAERLDDYKAEFA